MKTVGAGTMAVGCLVGLCSAASLMTAPVSLKALDMGFKLDGYVERHAVLSVNYDELVEQAATSGNQAKEIQQRLDELRSRLLLSGVDPRELD